MQIEITEKANADLEEIEDFLLSKWNEKVLLNFFDKLEEVLDHIASNKVVFQLHENQKYHKALITKHNTLVYIKTPEKITIIRILNIVKSL